MSPELHRRSFLKTTLTAAAVTGAGIAGAPMVSAAAGPGPAAEELPPVPGMTGDRRANELWYDYEQFFFYGRDEVTKAAYAAIKNLTFSPDNGTLGSYLLDYQKHRAEGTYPHVFLEQFKPAKDAFEYLSEHQLKICDKHYRHNPAGLIDAFVYCGEGTLWDPRMPVGSKVHMMNDPGGEPTKAWHEWHAMLRPNIFFGISPAYWAFIDKCVGLAWAVQSAAKPINDLHNPPLDRKVVAGMKRRWLRYSPPQLDKQFDEFPFPAER